MLCILQKSFLIILDIILFPVSLIFILLVFFSSISFSFFSLIDSFVSFDILPSYLAFFCSFTHFIIAQSNPEEVKKDTERQNKVKGCEFLLITKTTVFFSIKGFVRTSVRPSTTVPPTVHSSVHPAVIDFSKNRKTLALTAST